MSNIKISWQVDAASHHLLFPPEREKRNSGSLPIYCSHAGFSLILCGRMHACLRVFGHLCVFCVCIVRGFNRGHLKGIQQQKRGGCLSMSGASAGKLLWRRQQLRAPINNKTHRLTARKVTGSEGRREKRVIGEFFERPKELGPRSLHGVLLGEHSRDVDIAHSYNAYSIHEYISH